ncbi:hypothetical protein GCM10023213_14390 [Prosthecobacter algae]|uniref:Uncharacterized protein n=1 Tax=Prosthecobacter algae TaxID=1144682 RepID=A0ABP9NZP9_9BACT
MSRIKVSDLKKSGLFLLPNAIRSDEELELAVASAGDLEISIERKQAQMIQELADLKEKEQAIKERYSLEIDNLKSKLDAEQSRARAWCESNRERLFGDKKSITILAAELRFKATPGKCELSPDLDDADVIARIMALPDEDADLRDQLIRIDPQLDREAFRVLWNSTAPGSPEREKLANIGATVVKKETFVITTATGGKVKGESKKKEAA